MVKLLAIFRRTSGAILGTRSQYSPITHRMAALAAGTSIESTSRAMCFMISLWSPD